MALEAISLEYFDIFGSIVILGRIRLEGEQEMEQDLTGLSPDQLVVGLVAKAKSLAATSMGYVDDHNTPPRKEARRATADRG